MVQAIDFIKSTETNKNRIYNRFYRFIRMASRFPCGKNPTLVRSHSSDARFLYGREEEIKKAGEIALARPLLLVRSVSGLMVSVLPGITDSAEKLQHSDKRLEIKTRPLFRC
jgi:hypothetical protein